MAQMSSGTSRTHHRILCLDAFRSRSRDRPWWIPAISIWAVLASVALPKPPAQPEPPVTVPDPPLDHAQLCDPDDPDRDDVCDDENWCTYDWCDISVGECRHSPTHHGEECAYNPDPCLEDICLQGECTTVAVSGPCHSDADPCTLDWCIYGQCTHDPINCNDYNPCTTDYCLGGECMHDPHGGGCPDDGNPCTDDLCQGGVCTHPAIGGPCPDDGNECTDDFCQGGACVHPAHGGSCSDDGNECTDDLCIDGACTHEPRTGPCTDDENECTDDVCIDAECTHYPNYGPCDDGDPCTENDVCDGLTCIGEDIECDDSEGCTEEECVSGACVYTPVPNGTPCDDEDSCTMDDQCIGGVCTGTRFRICNDDNPCTDDECIGDGCVYVNNTRPCDDGNACTENDTCSGGYCSGTVIDCNDGLLCTINDHCDPEEGCLYDLLCDDDDPCTTDICDPQTGECEYEELWAPYDTCSAFGCSVTMDVPEFLFLNNDDDNGNGIADVDEPGPLAGEDDLRWLGLSFTGWPPEPECAPDSTYWLVFFWYGPMPSEYVRCYLGSDKTEPADVKLHWPPGPGLYCEGLLPTPAPCGLPLHFYIDEYDPAHDCYCCYRGQPFPVYRVGGLQWQRAAAGNGDNLCVANDPWRDDSMDVDLVGTIEPPIANITVHFKVWQFDEPSYPSLGTYSAVTDAAGEARVTVSVSAQLGNAYRAGASVLSDAITQPTQGTLDTISQQDAGWSGYLVPLVWSRMLAVMTLDLTIHNGGCDLDHGDEAGSEGSLVLEEDEEEIGAYILVNWDDDDGDGAMNDDGSWSAEPMPDLYENSVQNEDNLAKLVLSLDPLPNNGTIQLECTGYDAHVRLWSASTKETYLGGAPWTWELAEPDQRASFEQLSQDGLWIEGVGASISERNVSFVMSYADAGGQVQCSDTVKATVVMINLANAVYRDNNIWSQGNRGHAALVWKFLGPLARENLNNDDKFLIIEIAGPTDNKALSTMTQAGETVYGCFTNPGITYVQRLKIMQAGKSLVGAMSGYPAFGGNAIEPVTWDGKLNSITKMRCDGLVEVCYEINDVEVWGMAGRPPDGGVHYDITDPADNWSYNGFTGDWTPGSNGEFDNLEEHNDFDFAPLDWADTLMPATQCGQVTPEDADTRFQQQDLCIPIGSKGGN